MDPAIATSETGRTAASTQATAEVRAAVFRIASDARLLDVNETACRWLDYPREALLAGTLFDINPDIDRAHWGAFWRELREHGSMTCRTVHRRRDGSLFPVEATACLIASGGGGEEFAISVVQNLEDRLHTQRQLEDIARRLSEAQQIAHIGYWERDLRTQRVTWSDELYRLFGYEPGQFEATLDWFLEHVHGDDRAAVVAAVEAAMDERGQFEVDFRILHRDGRPRVMHSRGRVITDAHGRAVSLNGTMQDIDESHHVHRELTEALQRLNAAQRVAHVGSWDHDLTTDTEFWSDEMHRIFGYEPGEARVSHAFFLRHVFPEDRPRVAGELERALAGGEQYACEYRIVLADGRVRECQSRGRIVRGADGSPVRVYGTCQDVTDRRQAESALRRSEEHYRRAAETNRRLLSEVNHRVRNNLTGLLSMLRITRQETRDVEEFCELMRHRITAMTKAHNLLAGAQWHALDLHTLLRAIAVGYGQSDRPDPRIGIDGPTTWVSPRQVVPLALALNELFINAHKHGCYSTPDGSLRIDWRHDGEQLVMDWRETGGPPIIAPVKPSLGTELIHGFICFELNGQMDLTYPRDGAQHTLRVPLERLDLPADVGP